MEELLLPPKMPLPITHTELSACRRTRNRVLASAFIGALLLITSLFPQPLDALVASDPDRTDLAALLGADRFYAQGIDGTGARAAVIEGGTVWNGDAATAHVTEYFSHPDTWRLETGFNDQRDLWDRHTTFVGSFLGGRGPSPERTGIAPGVDLVSGGIARRWVGSSYTLNFTLTADSVIAPYQHFTQTAPVDVINSSWGYSDSAGNAETTRRISALAASAPATLFVAAAGNSGFTTNSVVGPASGMNVLAVGGLAYSDAAYDTRDPASSRGYSTYWDPINGTVSGVRASVDLLAPGRTLTTLRYGGQTGGNNPTLTGSFAESTRDATGLFGTSFAAPMVSGGAALLYAASYERMPANSASRDARVIRAVLLNSATKLDGWSAEASEVDGVLTTIRSLDPAQGAGRMNLDAAWDQYMPEAGAVAGLATAPHNFIGPVGWDLAEITREQSILYDFGYIATGEWLLTSTLAWHRDVSLDENAHVTEHKQADLDLHLWMLANDSPEWTLIAQSISEYNTVEHLFVPLDGGAEYRLEVRYQSDTFAIANASDNETFGLAWSLEVVPEPAATTLILALSVLLLTQTRRRCRPR